jgi:hypothetical protein
MRTGKSLTTGSGGLIVIQNGNSKGAIMKNILSALCLACLVLVAAMPLGAAPEDGRARIALFEPAAPASDPTLAAVLATVTDTVELSLACLDRYAVTRQPPTDPAKDLQKIRSYCAQNRIDQAIGGSATARTEGGYAFRLVVYDRLKDSITLVREGASNGALDMFDVTDALVVSLLDGLNGSHLQFGSLEVQSEPHGAALSLNGREAGTTPAALRNIPAGRIQVVARADGWEEGSAPVVIEDGTTATVVLNLVRSTGRLQLSAPEDAAFIVVGPDKRQRNVGPGIVADLPTGTYEIQARCPGLADSATQVRVERNAVTPFLPWTASYLVVVSDPPGAVIVVDDVEKGTTPGMVDVEPGKPHQVELKLAKHQSAYFETTAAPGTKNPLAATLVLLNGSISVETDLPSADVFLDGNVKGVTPCFFGNLSPGEHTIMIADVLKRKKFMTVGPPETVIVRPDEITDVSRTFHPGSGNLVIRGAARNAAVVLDGVKIEDRNIFTTGSVVPAGIFDLSVNGGLFQRWSGTATISPDVTTEINVAVPVRR